MSTTKENKMGVMPIRKLLINMSLPMMISMFVQALYNIVDSIFVAQVNESALTAVSLAFPVQNLMIAIGTGTGVGINALLSKSLGQKNYSESDKAANNGLFLALISSFVFLLFGLLFTEAYFHNLTKDAMIFEYGSTYLSIISVGSIGLYGQVTSERLLQSTGKSFYSMVTQITGAVINIILDPILIFGYFGFPRLEVAGAAIATVIGQIIAACLALIFNKRVNKEIRFNIKEFRPNGDTIKKIYSVGIPSIVMISINSVTIYVMNKILISFTPTATAVFGIYFKLQSFVLLPVFGLNNGMVPIIAYNYGAQNKQRIIETIKLSMKSAVVIMLLGLTVIQLIPETILSMFSASESMMNIGIPALRIISLSYVFAGFCIVASSIYQAFGKGLLSLFSAVSRQLVVLLPVAYLLSLTGDVNLIWWSYPISEIISVLVNIYFIKLIFDTRINNIGNI